MYVFGQTGIKEITLVSDKDTFILNEYVMVEDEANGHLPVEIIQTFALPQGTEKTIPKGCDLLYLKRLGIELDETIYLAKGLVLKPLKSPITPETNVRRATFEEVENILLHTSTDKGLTLGVIQGTEQIQNQLPEHLQNVAPGWKSGKAIPQEGVPFLIDYRKFREYPHIGIFGTSGSGKTFGMRVIQEELMKFSIPTLSFDPHQESVFDEPMPGLTNEQKIDFKDKYKVFYIGKDIGIPFSELKFDELVHLFNFVGALSEPQKAAMESLYEVGDTLPYLRQKITDLKTAFEEQEKAHYDRQELTHAQEKIYARLKNKVSGSATLQALSWKLDSLENTEIFNGDVISVEQALKKRQSAVIRGDIRRLQMISSYMIKKFYKKRRNYQDSREIGMEDLEYFPMFFVVMDESHNFAPKHDFNPTKQVLRTIALEARKYGVFLVMVTQKPDALDDAIVAQLNTKFIYRLKTASEMEMAQKETGLSDEEINTLPSLTAGSCFVSSPLLPKTFATRFRTTLTVPPNTKDPFDELDDYSPLNQDKEVMNYLMKKLPIHSTKIANLHLDVNNTLHVSLSVQELNEILKKMTQMGYCKAKKSPFGIEYS